MKILLVANNGVCFGIDAMFRVPNLGLCSVAANIDRSINEVKVVDLVAAGRNPEKYFLKLLKDYNPDLVGFSSMLFQFAGTYKFIKLAKAFNKNIVTVLGGYAATVDGYTIAQNDKENLIDYIVKGEGELAFDELVQSLQNGKDFSKVNGLIYRQDGNIIRNPQICLANLDDLKLPDRGARLIKKGFYILNQEADAVETSRGCVYECNFCSINHMYGKSYRKYKFERVLADIRDAAGRGAKSIFFVDDNITLDGKRFKSLCETIKSEKLNHINYLLQASVKGIKDTKGLPEAMREAGITYVFLGIENAYDANLAFMNKDDQLTVKDTEEVVRHLSDNNIKTIGGFLLGQPNDTKESLMYNFEFAKKIGIELPVFNIVTPYPNTGLREEYLKENLITNLDDYSKYDCWEVNVKTKHLSSQEIYDIRLDMEARYPIESGSLKRNFKTHPLVIIHILIRWLFRKPSDVLMFLGIRRRRS
ncbi:MAG: radical SAM protein [Ignavibacteriae bacterium]|nr:radical SAM protein [Ignavibacteriota bacterium]